MQPKEPSAAYKCPVCLVRGPDTEKCGYGDKCPHVAQVKSAATEQALRAHAYESRAFETDVSAAQHEDPMTDEDWLTLARKALEVADDPGF